MSSEPEFEMAELDNSSMGSSECLLDSSVRERKVSYVLNPGSCTPPLLTPESVDETNLYLEEKSESSLNTEATETVETLGYNQSEVRQRNILYVKEPQIEENSKIESKQHQKEQREIRSIISGYRDKTIEFMEMYKDHPRKLMSRIQPRHILSNKSEKRLIQMMLVGACLVLPLVIIYFTF